MSLKEIGCNNIIELHNDKEYNYDGYFRYGKKALNEIYTTESDEILIIPEGVEEILPGAFRNNKNIKIVIFPSTLKRMGEGAFSNSSVETFIFQNEIKLIQYPTSLGENSIKPLILYREKKSNIQTELDKNKNLKSTPITHLDLSVRSYKALINNNIQTIEKLTQITITDISKIRNLGRKSIFEILNKLSEHGYSLKEES